MRLAQILKTIPSRDEFDSDEEYAAYLDKMNRVRTARIAASTARISRLFALGILAHELGPKRAGASAYVDFPELNGDEKETDNRVLINKENLALKDTIIQWYKTHKMLIVSREAYTDRYREVANMLKGRVK